jgi:hypothetical protein
MVQAVTALRIDAARRHQLGQSLALALGAGPQ